MEVVGLDLLFILQLAVQGSKKNTELTLVNEYF